MIGALEKNTTGARGWRCWEEMPFYFDDQGRSHLRPLNRNLEEVRRTHVGIWERESLTEGSASARGLGTGRRLLWLQGNEQEKQGWRRGQVES